MSDNDSKLWNHVPPVRQRRPGELLWEIVANHVRWSAELKIHGESVGWEAQILRNGDLVIGRTFIMKEYATKWAESERRDLEKGVE